MSSMTSLGIAVLTISDTRTPETDKSGNLLVEEIKSAGHQVIDHLIVKDDIYQIRAEVSNWIASSSVQVVITTGGTGFSNRDSTPEAISVLFDKPIEGFGELFRQVSYEEIGTSTIQSRAVAGMANNTAVFCVPGSSNACRTAWHKVIKQQIDSTHKPCNFAANLTRSE